MARKKAEPEPKSRFSKYWVEIEGRGESTLPPDAPVRRGYSAKKSLCEIADCDTWDDIEIFFGGKWHDLKLLDPPTRRVYKVSFTFTTESRDTDEEDLSRLAFYGSSDRKIDLVSKDSMAVPFSPEEPDED